MPLALVTGASSGIGLAYARQLAGQGYRLIVVARDGPALAAAVPGLLARGSPAVAVLPADLTDAGEREAVAERLRNPDDPVDVLVNNAGTGLTGGFLDNPVAALLGQLELNVTAILVLTRAAVPGMLARGHGAIVNVASVAGLLPGRGVTYGPSKAWVVAFSENLSMSLTGTGVRVQALCPGLVRTRFHQRAGMDMTAVPRWAYVDVEAVVRASLADLRRNRPISVPGGLYRAVTGGLWLLPRPVGRWLSGRVGGVVTPAAPEASVGVAAAAGSAADPAVVRG